MSSGERHGQEKEPGGSLSCASCLWPLPDASPTFLGHSCSPSEGKRQLARCERSPSLFEGSRILSESTILFTTCFYNQHEAHAGAGCGWVLCSARGTLAALKADSWFSAQGTPVVGLEVPCGMLRINLGSVGSVPHARPAPHLLDSTLA